LDAIADLFLRAFADRGQTLGLSEFSTFAVVFAYACGPICMVTYATYSFAWFPYRFYLIEYLMGRIVS